MRTENGPRWRSGHSRLRLVGALLCAGLAAALLPAAAAGASPYTCADVFVLFARGSGQALGNSPETTAFFDELQISAPDGLTLSTRELGQEAHRGYAYPAAGRPEDFLEAKAPLTGGLTGGRYGASVAAGVAEAWTYLTDRNVYCPDEALVVGGYSQGAQVIGEALFSVLPAVTARVAFVALFGDPKLRTNTDSLLFPPACRGETFPWRRGTAPCDSRGGILDPRAPYVPDVLAARTGSWCDRFDGVCTGNPLFLAVASSHERYTDGWVRQAAIEAAARLAAVPG